jgi:dihydrodipicolinate synthase/N-acetylneuraminate lyase
MTDLSGVVPVLTTPFDEDGAVDEESLGRVARSHAEEGCDAVALFGLASEFYKLTDEECDRIARAAIDALDGTGTPVVHSITDHATRVAVRRAERAAERGADALMVLPPFFLDPPAEQVCAHVERVAGAVDLPVVVQYAPTFTGTTLSPATLADLADRVGNLAYYKVEARPAGPYITELLARADVDALVGNAGWQMLDAYERGAVGVMPGSPIAPVYVEIQARHERGDSEGAAELHADLLPLLNHITQSAEMAFQYGKRILHRRGLIDSPAARGPAYEPDGADDERFERLYKTVAQWL